MHPKDLALMWERWAKGESLFDIATSIGVSASTLHQELQHYLDTQASANHRLVGAA